MSSKFKKYSLSTKYSVHLSTKYRKSVFRQSCVFSCNEYKLFFTRRRLQRERGGAQTSSGPGTALSPQSADERLYSFNADGENTKNFIISQTLPSYTSHAGGHIPAGQCMTLTRTQDPRLKEMTVLESPYQQYGYTADGQTIQFTPARPLGPHIYESPQFEHKPS